jgi:hypothetical protein
MDVIAEAELTVKVTTPLLPLGPEAAEIVSPPLLEHKVTVAPDT